ncbi:MAG: DUF1292 domain-containing protein [Clostridiaceae bacterium]|nr:DUF1292 domain-containing protein [Clostridiaceae bacterium]
MEVKDIMSFKNEENEKVDLEVVAKIYLGEQEYILLSPVDEEEKDESDMFAYRVDLEEDKEVLNAVEDEEEFKAIRKEYKKLLYNKE